MGHHKKHLILLGEDNEDDVLLFRHSAKKAGLNADILWLEDGEQIASYLAGESPYQDRTNNPLPVLTFLDGQLHHRPSLGLLRWMLENPTTRHIPVTLLTGSLDPTICHQAKEIGALECLGKPMNDQAWALLKQLLERTQAASMFVKPGP